MASLSLPKVLTQRKASSPETERENFERSQNVSIAKAINSQENPVKEKHVRSAIIGTFQEKSCRTFWNVVLRLPLQGNPIVCWKFAHVLHKVLREGHPCVLEESYRQRKTIVELDKLWGHLKEGYGKLISCYCRLLVYKLEFHRRNPRFPGNLQVTDEQLEEIGEHDVNIYFQLCCEMFDYMEEILVLQAAVFGCLDMSRSNSMTNSGQCRLASLIACIQDSSHLYDYMVKLLFKLHSVGLPAETLQGHRDRFLKQFRQLQQFYISSSNLQYFKYLIQVPLLPDNPPNFLISTDFSSHISPVVILHSPEPSESIDTDSVDMNLVDVTDSDSFGASDTDIQPIPMAQVLAQELAQKESIIQQLVQQIEQLRMEIQRMKIEYQRVVDDLKRQMNALELQIADQQREIQMLNHEIADYKEKLEKTTDTQDSTKLAEKVKQQEDKFHKMKDIYNKLREEHIVLIRQKADIEKQSLSSKARLDELENNEIQLQGQIRALHSQKNVTEEKHQEYSKIAVDKLNLLVEERDQFQEQNKSLQNSLADMKVKLDDLERQLEQEFEAKKLLIITMTKDRKSFQDTEDGLRASFSHEKWLFILKLLTEAENVIQTTMNEYSNPAMSMTTCTPEYLLQMINSVTSSTDAFENGSSLLSENPEVIISSIPIFAHHVSLCLLYGKATSQASPNIEQGDNLSSACKALGTEVLNLLTITKKKEHSKSAFDHLRQTLNSIKSQTEVLLPNMETDVTQKLGDLVDQELTDMEKAIEEAAKRIADMLAKSKEGDHGVKLEVNGKILDACTTLMQAIRVLVQRSKDLQGEIAQQGKGTASTKEFYNRNHRWSEGLISAAKVVGLAANFLVDAADKVVLGDAKFEELVVASQEIAAATAQLVVSSKVKADRGSTKLTNLSQASRKVTEATGNVVATAKSCAQLIEDSTDLDFTKMSLHQAKLLEMESQVHILELESNLEKERLKLASLRKRHYHLAGPSEGWEVPEN